MLTLTAQTPLVDGSADSHGLLEDLQNNILSAHLRPSTHYFFLSFASREQATRVLGGLARGDGLPEGFALEPESKSRQRRAVRAAKAAQQRYEPTPGYSTSLMLSARCYTQFLQNRTLPDDPAFRQGLSGRDSTLIGAEKLNDPPELWRGPPAHALFAVAYDAQAVDWLPVRDAIRRWLADFGVTVREDEGYVLRHPTKNYAIEPFGYRDAISQPLFFEEDLRARAKHEGAAATVNGGRWSSFAPLSLVLARDPNGASPDSHGTYVAYRKLLQRVDVFYQQADRLAGQAPVAPGSPSLSRNEVADRLIGRRLDGTPLDGGPDLNNFVYPSNSVCPRHAHVRVVNPRTNTPWSRDRRIVRRSTVFGPRLSRESAGRPIIPTRAEDGTAAPAVGLLFFCCQADIHRQFELIQAQWANDLSFGADTVIGQPDPRVARTIALNGSARTLAYESVVDVLEGEYFFAPSISFCNSL
jgi:Dyp-type peroxidase family